MFMTKEKLNGLIRAEVRKARGELIDMFFKDMNGIEENLKTHLEGRLKQCEDALSAFINAEKVARDKGREEMKEHIARAERHAEQVERGLALVAQAIERVGAR